MLRFIQSDDHLQLVRKQHETTKMATATFMLSCASCDAKCAVNARFCSSCGAKLPATAFAAVRTKLPSLDHFRAPQANVNYQDTGFPTGKQSMTMPLERKRVQPSKKRPPARIERLVDPPVVCKQKTKTEECDNQLQWEFKLKQWMVTTRRVLESLLEVKKRLERPELDVYVDIDRYVPGETFVDALTLDLGHLSEYLTADRNLHAKCLAMLEKIGTLARNIHVQVHHSAGSQSKSSPVLKSNQKPADAEITVRGPDGKPMFFKARDHRSRQDESHNDTKTNLKSHPEPTKVVDSQGKSPSRSQQRERSPRRCVQISTQFARERWLNAILMCVSRIRGRRVVLRVEEDDDLSELVLTMYHPVSSATSTVKIPLGWLAWILPPSMQWYRLSEVRRSVAVEYHWKRCLKHVLRCVSWKSHDQVEVEFPIQYRQVRMLIFRTFAIFYGLLSVRLQTDLSLKLVFVNARSSQKISLIIPEKQIVSCLGEYRDKLTMASTRRVFYAQVCENLFFEYTSRGYELLFPGVIAKGTHRRHPLEVSVLEKHQEELEKEHQRLRLAMSQCVEQAGIIARRRMEQYHERMRRLKKIRQQQAVRKIQAHSRTLIARIQFRRQQEEQRRMSQLENFAAQVIQHHVRKRTELERQLRLQQIKHRDAHGTRFRFACRINGSFLLVLVTLDEIDRATNSVDCNVSVVHPVTSQAALTRVPYEELLQLTGEAALSHWSRRDIVEALVRNHLNVFRSAKHRVLVVTPV